MTGAATKAAAIAIAGTLIAELEGCHLRAYPDPRSAMARALGPKGIARFHRDGIVPPAVARLKAAPWTIGWGATGPDIVQGTTWTRSQCRQRLDEDLVRFHAEALRIWPGADRLHPAALAALISLVYNRGPDLDRDPKDPKDRRLEMRMLLPVVVQRDYKSMARLIRLMQRIWVGEGMQGLLTRREREAALCDQAARETADSTGQGA